MATFIYRNEKTKEISFPLGGIGSGSIGLSGNGRLIDWEIYNRPNKCSLNRYSHFLVKAEQDGKVVDTRVLNGDLQPPYMGQIGTKFHSGYGYGPAIETMAGVPHFERTEFIGEYPIAQINLEDKNFPGKITLTAFNPFIPLNDKDSSIPAAFFDIEFHNTTKNEITYTLCLSVANPFSEEAVNTYHQQEDIKYIKLSSNKYSPEQTEFGDLTIATDAGTISYQEYWYRGTWFDSLGVFWKDINTYGKLKNRNYKDAGKYDMASLAAHIQVNPMEKKHIRFIISWSFPNTYRYWEHSGESSEPDSPRKKTWKNYYATVFKDSTESAVYSLKNFDVLYKDTLKFKNALFSSSLPSFALEAVSANLSTLKTATVLRLEDGSFYGWEGCQAYEGSCEGSCTHVWNYAYALPFLFPKLERSMRDLDYQYNMFDDGFMAFRLQLPLGTEPSRWMACVDGQMGGIIKAYRDWKISGNTEWLRSNWGTIKKSLEFAWAETNEFRWDPDKDGVIDGRQHHTLDMELYGPNSWLNGFYLAALKAAAEMAEYLGEQDKAEEYRNMFENGKKWTDRYLFNGEYYVQKIDLKDPSVLKTFDNGTNQVYKNYWSEEHQEIKYQIGEGCSIDQVVAQWHANLCGLGEIFDKSQRLSALKAIYKYNFKKEGMRNFFNPCRIFCLNDEKGVTICEWPDNKYKPTIPIPYSEECMNGFEYQAAIHMLQEGMIEEGEEIIKAIRERFDGEKRNPWNEFECGSNYARSMASYAILNAYSGFAFDMVRHKIGFDPIKKDQDNVSFFWSLDSGWGKFIKTKQQIILEVLYGKLDLLEVDFPFIKEQNISSVVLGEKPIEFIKAEGKIILHEMITIEEKKALKIVL